MSNPHIGIDKHRWMELRDGLFIYVRTRKQWSMDIVVAPRERVSVLRRSELPVIRTIPFVSYAVLFGAPLFAVCALIMLGADRNAPLQALGWALVVSLGLTVLFASVMLLIGRLKGRRETVLYVSGNFFSPLIRFKHEEGTNPELEAFLDALSADYGSVSDSVPLGEWYRVPTPVRSVLGALYVPFWLGILWPHESGNEVLTLIFGGAVVMMFVLYLIFPAMQVYVYLRNPKATKEARAALLDGDYAAAELILKGVLEKSPDQAYANHLQTAVVLVRGDLTQAAVRSAIVERSRILQYLWSPFVGVMFQRM